MKKFWVLYNVNFSRQVLANFNTVLFLSYSSLILFYFLLSSSIFAMSGKLDLN